MHARQRCQRVPGPGRVGRVDHRWDSERLVGGPELPAFEQALSACKDLEPPGFTGAKATPQQTTARLEFAQCMRDNGVPDFPDPTPNGPLVDTNRIPSAATTGGMSILNAAMQKCSATYAAELGLKGQ